jgi:hypothetical protein
MAKATVFLGRGVVKPYFELGAGYSIYSQTQSVTLISPRLGLKNDFTDQLSMKINVQYNQMFNKIDGDKTVDVTIDGETMEQTVPGLYANNVGYLGVNVGVTYTLFDYFGRF